MAAVADQVITDRYALYLSDCIEGMAALPSDSIHLSIYSPPFAGLYHYSSSERDLSNSRTYDEFLDHYRYVVREIARLTLPGRVTCVHAMDIPQGNTGTSADYLLDFPGHVIKLHDSLGMKYFGRYAVWKEPLAVRNRTMTKSLSHQTIVNDSSRCSAASADYLLVFRKAGVNPIPITHPHGFLTYAGSREIPPELWPYREFAGKQTENRYSHWIWRQYASAFWDDIRLNRLLPFKDARDPEDEKHVHPLQLDVIERAVTLWSNPDEIVLTPFMGVGSEVYGAVSLGRRGLGFELKPSYFRQARANLAAFETPKPDQMAFTLDEPSPNGHGPWVGMDDPDEVVAG